MNISKEKKLNAIKSEISEITDFVISNKTDDVSKIDPNDKIENNTSDTYILTNVVKGEDKAKNYSELISIKNELNKLSLMLSKQEIVLKEILLKLG